MRPALFYKLVAKPAVDIFDPKFNSREAHAMILAIGLQESDFRSRQQLIGGVRDWWKSERGPAVSFFQFERVGIRGVLEHKASEQLATDLLLMFSYPPDVEVVFQALKHHDLLSAAFARLALWRIPDRLPAQCEMWDGWRQYLRVWAPGKPKIDKWEQNWNLAWRIVNGDDSGWL